MYSTHCLEQFVPLLSLLFINFQINGIYPFYGATFDNQHQLQQYLLQNVLFLHSFAN